MVEVWDTSWIQKEEVIKCQQQKLYHNNIFKFKKIYFQATRTLPVTLFDSVLK